MERLPILLLLSGLLALLSSVILGWLLIPFYLHNQILQQIRLENGSATFEKWKDVSVPIFITFHLFNVTNPEEVGRDGEKPILQELGPYVYEQKRVKTNITFDEGKDTISSRQFVTYHFRPELSRGTEDDLVTTLNLPLIGIGKLAEKVGYMAKIALNMYVGRFREEPFVRKKVRELLFEGYHVPLMETIQNTTKKIMLPSSMFGFYYGKNGTDDGVYEIRTGVQDPSKFGEIVSWEGQSELSWWGKSSGGEFCNKINGSDASIFPPFVKKDRVVRIFSSDLCRSLYLTFTEDVEYKGVPALKFTVPKTMLERGDINPENRCFCNHPDPVGDNCPKSGVIELSACRKGAPIVASTPHFLDGDETYVTQSIGLSPDRTKHETYLQLEPNTGLVLEGRKRIQINVESRPYTGLDVLKNLPLMTFPIFWVEESASATDSTVERLQGKLLFALDGVKIGKWIFVILSSLLILFAIGIFCLRTRRKREFV